MPKETFYNLPQEKRNRIEDVAIQEFKEYNYDASSINRIVENSEISKGSFYQYFEDKKDLYKHIFSIIADKKLEYMSPVLMNPFKHDLFTLIREMYKSGLSFAIENPDFLKIGNNLLAIPSHPIYDEILKDNKGKSDEVFEMLLENSMERGEIRDNLDIKMVAFILTNLNILVVDYYLKETDIKKYNENMISEIEKVIDIMQYGISNMGRDDKND